MYVMKFRGAGQGAKALVAEVIAGELARLIGLPIPEIVLVELDPDLARTEPDPEIPDLIRASGGTNVALDYLPGAINFHPLVEQPDSLLASSLVWFAAFVPNLSLPPTTPHPLLSHRHLPPPAPPPALPFHP